MGFGPNAARGEFPLTQKEKRLAAPYNSNTLTATAALESVCDGLKAAVEEELQNLEERCKQLSVRLAPVLKPQVPATSPTPRPPADSPLGQWLADLHGVLCTRNQDLRDLIGLLEI